MEQADGPAIVLNNYHRHNEMNSERKTDIDVLAVHKNYVWDGTGMADFEDDGKVEESVTGFGALPNYHPYLFNIYPTVEEVDDTITSRASGSPGIGK
jgi:hypothetical protein